MEEETPTNGTNGADNHEPDQPEKRGRGRPKGSFNQPDFLPGASQHPNQYPKSGSQEEFWERCEIATTLRSTGTPYKQIGLKLGVDTSAAHRMVRRYLRAAARFYPAIELRELLAHALREQRRYVMVELEELQGIADATDKRLACIARSESLIIKEAQLFGLVGVGGDINIYAHGNNDESARPQLSQEVAVKVRSMIRDTRKVMDAEDAKFSITDESKDKGNGDQGKVEPA